MQGLYKREREDVFDAEGFYHTGDGGHFDQEGYLFFEARLGEMIKTSGANVTPREVEVVMELQPEVQSAYVVGIPHPSRGQNVAAAVILNDGESIAAEALRRRLREELSAYKVPRYIAIYDPNELPFTETGKIKSKVLAAMLAERMAKEDPRE
jgi:acyl-coenzyme A synthetase/AMP-(fatty) acid ligase